MGVRRRLMRVQVTHIVHHEHGEFPDEEDTLTFRIESWNDLPNELRDYDGRWLDVVRIEVVDVS
jgi:hypothetical protein